MTAGFSTKPIQRRTPMKLLLLLLLLLAAFGAEGDISKTTWPRAIRDFPRGEKIAFSSGGFAISRRVPADPELQAMGGSGGPMIEIKVRGLKKDWSATLVEQSVGERLLQFHGGKPQFEIWGRGGGGNWSRSLYRYLSGEYRYVRTDQFEEVPRHNNQHAAKAELPSVRRGKGDQQSEVLYFVQTNLPNQ
jgi:hypothetical protein